MDQKRRKTIKKIFSLLTMLVIVLSFSNFTRATAVSILSEKTLKYYATVLGTTTEEVEKLLVSKESFDEIVNDLLLSRKIENNHYNEENNIDAKNFELKLSISECSELFGISQEEVINHISICGVGVYNKIIDSFNLLEPEIKNQNGVQLMSSGSGTTNDELSDELWRLIYTSAHTGNILITKDSVNRNYRHGHVGVVRSHTATPKQVVDAWTPASGLAADEVLCSNLINSNLDFSQRDTYWSQKKSLILTYPTNTTVQQRESAGNQTWFYAESDYYRYELFNQKETACDSSSRKLNCVGLAVRAYFFKAGVDIVPQVGRNSVLLPQQIYNSSVITAKTYTGNGYENLILVTPNFYQIDWGIVWGS